MRTDDNPECRADFGTPTGQKPGCGFPVMKLCALFSLTTGAWLADESGRTYDHDLPTALPLLQKHLHQGDVLAADRAFSAWWVMALAVAQGADCVLRLHQARRADFRRGRRLGPGERLLSWPKPPRPDTCPLTPAEYAALPATLAVRMVRSTASQPGDRTRGMITLRDPLRYPAAALAALYRRRWQIELNFDDLKTSLGMNHLACQSTDMALRLVAMYQCAYNLIRALMQQSAHAGAVPLYRLSFKGTATLLAATQPWLRPGGRPCRRKDLLALANPHRRRPRPAAPRPRRTTRLQTPPLPVSAAHQTTLRNESHPPPEEVPQTTRSRAILVPFGPGAHSARR